MYFIFALVNKYYIRLSEGDKYIFCEPMKLHTSKLDGVGPVDDRPSIEKASPLCPGKKKKIIK